MVRSSGSSAERGGEDHHCPNHGHAADPTPARRAQPVWTSSRRTVWRSASEPPSCRRTRGSTNGRQRRRTWPVSRTSMRALTLSGASPPRSRLSISPTGPGTSAGRSPRDCANGWHRRAPSSATPKSCSWMSPPPARIPSPPVTSTTLDQLSRDGVTIFLTTHRLEEAERLCDRVAILNRTLQAIGTPRELRDRLFTRSLRVRTREPLSEPHDLRRMCRCRELERARTGLLPAHRRRPGGRGARRRARTGRS